MTNKEAIETIKCAIAEVEWEYPMDYAAAFDKAVEALEKEEAGWISVKDRLPGSGEAVLVAVFDKEGYFYRAIAVRYPCGDWDSNDDYFNMDEADVRYWMPLPEPPKEEQNG